MSLALLGIVAFFAASYSATALAGFAAATLVLMLAVRAWGRLSLWRLHTVLKSSGERLFAGETYTVFASIVNRNF